MSFEITRIPGAWETDQDFPQPNWKVIRAYILQEYTEADQPLVWHEASLQWLRIVQSALGEEYRLCESKNFLMLSAQPASRTKYLLTGCEGALETLRRSLGSLCWSWKNGKSVVLLFEDLPTYYRYISHFYGQDGEHMQSGGVFLNRGYCHLALPPQREAMPALVHELVHLCLCQLRLPTLA